jgi:hypothetical protein
MNQQHGIADLLPRRNSLAIRDPALPLELDVSHPASLAVHRIAR